MEGDRKKVFTSFLFLFLVAGGYTKKSPTMIKKLDFMASNVSLFPDVQK